MRLSQSRNLGHWLAWLLAVLLGLGLLFSSKTASHSDGASRPDWTERVSFSWGEDLYFVGVATRAKTIEEGRQQAFEIGKREITNYLQGASLNGLTIHTERTWEEPQADGSVTVWRLLRISAEELRGAAEPVRAMPGKRGLHRATPSLASDDTSPELLRADPYTWCLHTYVNRPITAWINCNLNYPLLP